MRLPRPPEQESKEYPRWLCVDPCVCGIRGFTEGLNVSALSCQPHPAHQVPLQFLVWIKLPIPAGCSTASLYVRFAPESGHSEYRTACPLSANSDIREEFHHCSGVKFRERRAVGHFSRGEDSHGAEKLYPQPFAIGCFIATATQIPGLGTAQTDKVKTAMADLKAKTDKLGAPKVEGKDLYFGTTKVDNSVVDAVAKEHGGVATLFVKSWGSLRARGHDGQ